MRYYFFVFITLLFLGVPANVLGAEAEEPRKKNNVLQKKKERKIKLNYELEFEYVWADSQPKTGPYFQFDKFVIEGRFRYNPHLRDLTETQPQRSPRCAPASREAAPPQRKLLLTHLEVQLYKPGSSLETMSSRGSVILAPLLILGGVHLYRRNICDRQ